MVKRCHIAVRNSTSPDFGAAFSTEFLAQTLKQAQSVVCKQRFLDSACYFAVIVAVGETHCLVAGRLDNRAVHGRNVHHYFHARSIVEVSNQILAKVLMNLPQQVADAVFKHYLAHSNSGVEVENAWNVAMKLIHSSLHFFIKTIETCVADAEKLKSYADLVVNAAAKHGLGLISESMATREMLGLLRRMRCSAA